MKDWGACVSEGEDGGGSTCGIETVGTHVEEGCAEEGAVSGGVRCEGSCEMGRVGGTATDEMRWYGPGDRMAEVMEAMAVVG